MDKKTEVIIDIIAAALIFWGLEALGFISFHQPQWLPNLF